MSADQRRVPHARAFVAAGAIVACAFLLFLGRPGTWYFDEWTFILTAPDWTVATYFQPHNEHPAILFRALYALLLHTVGLRTYLPYLVALLLAHLANILLLFEVVRRRAGDLIAIAAACLLMLLGAGWDDLLWAFQVAWLLSIAFGLGMMLALESRRPAVAAACLLVSLAFSGVGLAFAIVAVVQLGARAETRRELLWFVPVGIALAVWYVLFGRFGEHPNPQPSASNVLLDPAYAVWGLGQSAAGLIGEGGPVGLAVLVAAAGAIAWRWARHGADAFVIGVAAGLIGFYLFTGLTRAQLGITQSGSARYVYVAAVFWLILLADAARSLPWRGTWRPVLIACVFLAVFNSAVLLFEFATARTVVMNRQVADYYALAAERSDPCLDGHALVDPLVMPALLHPADYYRSIDLFGDPIDGRRLADRASYDAGVRNLKKAGC